ncbi:uncharacterized protein LOC124159870 isoform X2 [Ischnura elegans]|uniref:uncharacterized protein LOC124159870 isoform X2 n=1 Tax=Ischnura elegans TaxID=197161 RepID=UPI001ED8B1A0|nr:uncharacterized protein LOC124159870 isoform X2 [Ischnura elegans]
MTMSPWARKPPAAFCRTASWLPPGGPLLVLAVAAFAVLSAAGTADAGPYDYTRTQLTSASDYPDYPAGVRYDEYPVVVPKRAALLIDKLMVALHRAMDEPHPKMGIVGGLPGEKTVMDNVKDLQRREPQKGRVYWRCYFNAVTCFKKK